MTKEEAQNPAEGKLKALQAAMSKIEKTLVKVLSCVWAMNR